MKCEVIQEMISGYIDGELTQQDAQQVRVHLESCEHCQAIHKDLKQVISQLNQLSYRETHAQALAAIDQDLQTNTAQSAGWILLLLAFLLMAGSAIYAFFTTPGQPLLFRLIHGSFMLGSFILFLTVLRQRLKTYKNDKYRKVKL